MSTQRPAQGEQSPTHSSAPRSVRLMSRLIGRMLGRPAVLDAPVPASAERSAEGPSGQRLALEYFARCRADLAAAGVKDPGWDRGLEQRIADDMAGLLVRDRRWLLTFADGVPRLQAVEPGAVLVRLDDAGQLASLIRDAVPADSLPLLLEVGVRRLGGMVARGGPSGGAGSEFAN